MSTHWGYHCSTCESSSPHWFGDGQELLRELHAQATAGAASPGYGLLWRRVMAYLRRHDGHRVCLESEFGDQVPLEACKNPSDRSVWLFTLAGRRLSW